MKIAVELDFTYEQILSLIKQLPKKDQLRLEKELSISKYLSTPPCQFNVQELHFEIDSALREAKQGYGCSQDKIRAKFLPNE